MLRQLNRLWKIVREVNLEAIRKRAETPTPVLIVSATPEERTGIASLLLGGDLAPNPWLALAAPEEVNDAVRTPTRLALLVSNTAQFPASLESARRVLVSQRVPTATILVGSFGYLDTFARGGEERRIVLPSPQLDENGTPEFAERLFDLVEPDTRIALARQFPGLRQPFFELIIEETSRANASYAFSTALAEIVPLLDVPLNVGDIVVLTKNQAIMAYRIALAAGKEGKPMDVMGEVIGVVGGSLLFRQVARELVGLIPVLGIVPKVAVAYGGTWAIGRAVEAWATGAEEATRRSLKQMYSTGLTRGRRVARQLAARSSTAA